MLYVILMIIKIIGIILLGIIGLLLLILLTILLVPIRYRIAASHGKEFCMEARVSWLLHFIHARVTHLEGIFHIRVRVFGFIIFDNLNPKAPKTKIKNKKKKAKIKTPVKHKKDKDIIKEHNSDTLRIDKTNKSTVINQENTEIKKEGKLLETQTKYSDDKLQDKEKLHEETQDNQKDNVSLFQKIIRKMKSIKTKIVESFLGIKKKIIELFETAVSIKQKINLIISFIKDEFNRKGIQITYSSVKKLLKHILPTKLRSRIIFGTGDPCTTGQALGAFGILYSFYGDKVQIIPDFENARIEGTHNARGRIRLITVLIIVIKLILDKRFKILKRNFQILKEAL